MNELAQHIATQNGNRREWTIHDTPTVIEAYTLEEAQELTDAISLFFLIENPDFEIASEIGDVGYLCLKYQSAFGELPESMIGAWMFAQETAELAGLDMATCIEMKIERNSIKYPDHFSSNGWGYDMAREKSKTLYKTMGGDKAFYRWYMEAQE